MKNECTCCNKKKINTSDVRKYPSKKDSFIHVACIPFSLSGRTLFTVNRYSDLSLPYLRTNSMQILEICIELV